MKHFYGQFSRATHQRWCIPTPSPSWRRTRGGRPHGASSLVSNIVRTPLVVVPAHELDKGVVEGNAGLGVEDRAVVVADEVLRHNGVLSVREDALELVLRGALDLGLDVIVARGLLELGGQVNDRHVNGRHTEGHTSELAVEAGDDLADSLGRTSAGGDDVGERRAATAPVLGRGTVDGLLGGGGGVHSAHETLSNAELVVDNLGKRSKAVGGARRVRDDVVGGVVRVEVHANDEHGRVSRGRRDDDLARTTLEVGRSLLSGGEHTSRLDDVVGAVLAPGDGSGVTLSEDGDLLAVDNELAVAGAHLTVEAAVDRVVLEHVGHVLKVDEGVVDGNDLSIGVVDGVAEHNAANTTETVDTNSNHFEESWCVRVPSPCLYNSTRTDMRDYSMPCGAPQQNAGYS